MGTEVVQRGVVDGNAARAMLLAGSLSRTQELSQERNIANKSTAPSLAEQHSLDS